MGQVQRPKPLPVSWQVAPKAHAPKPPAVPGGSQTSAQPVVLGSHIPVVGQFSPMGQSASVEHGVPLGVPEYKMQYGVAVESLGVGHSLSRLLGHCGEQKWPSMPVMVVVCSPVKQVKSGSPYGFVFIEGTTQIPPSQLRPASQVLLP